MGLIFFVLLVIFAYVVGKALEQSHLKSLDQREKELGGITVTNIREAPAGTVVETSAVCIGHIVVSPSYWRMIQAGVRSVFGGEIKGVKMTLDQGRREAIIRMTRHAASMGCDLIINTRLETSVIGSNNGDGKGLSCVEFLAYGTAIRSSRSGEGQA